MTVLLRIAAGLFLIAHGLVHLLYLMAKVDDPGFPFTWRESWLVPGAVRRPIAVVLIVATVAAFALLGLAMWGVPGLSSVWPTIAIVSAALSLVLLVAFWNAHLVAGICIDVALIVLAAIHPGWIDEIIG